ncbi:MULTISPECIES: hypothetical protein [Nostocales]|nr:MULTISPECIES: hypothetical protein [Nostocales]
MLRPYSGQFSVALLLMTDPANQILGKIFECRSNIVNLKSKIEL